MLNIVLPEEQCIIVIRMSMPMLLGLINMQFIFHGLAQGRLYHLETVLVDRGVRALPFGE